MSSEKIALRRGAEINGSAFDELVALFDKHDKRMARQIMVMRIGQIVSLLAVVYAVASMGAA